MTAKDKAIELVERILTHVHQGGEAYKTTEEREFDNAKECALICVDEVIEIGVKNNYKNTIIHWQEVKTEINKL